MIVEAQGGEKRTKYGDKIIKIYSERLTDELGKGYSDKLLKDARLFFIKSQKGLTVSNFLSWSHYQEVLRISNIDEINYYIDVSIKNNLLNGSLYK